MSLIDFDFDYIDIVSREIDLSLVCVLVFLSLTSFSRSFRFPVIAIKINLLFGNYFFASPFL